MYDGLLDIHLGENYPGHSLSSLVAFADDVEIIATGRDTVNLESTINIALAAVSEWMEDNGQRLLVTKTEAVMLTSKRCYEIPSFMLSGEPVQLKE